MGHASDVFTSVAGDLLLTVRVKPHAYFKLVNKKDVETEV